MPSLPRQEKVKGRTYDRSAKADSIRKTRVMATETRKREAEAEERVTKRRKREIPKATKRYLVSNMGRVQMNDRKITPNVNKGEEYPRIQIKGCNRYIAEIVLLTFGSPRPSPPAHRGAH